MEHLLPDELSLYHGSEKLVLQLVVRSLGFPEDVQLIVDYVFAEECQDGPDQRWNEHFPTNLSGELIFDIRNDSLTTCGG